MTVSEEATHVIELKIPCPVMVARYLATIRTFQKVTI
jgi:hypothetical protein